MGEPPPPKRKVIRREDNVQKRVVAWLRERPDWMVLRLENAAKRAHGVARDKQLGLHVGAPDLVLLHKKQVVWLELKQSDERKPSDAQKQCHAELRARGQAVIVGYGYEDTINRLEIEESAQRQTAVANGKCQHCNCQCCLATGHGLTGGQQEIARQGKICWHCNNKPCVFGDVGHAF